MYEIVLTETAEKQLRKLESSIQERIINALERLRFRPEMYVTKLVGDPALKFRVGDYRILLDIDQVKLIILVIKIAHRKSVYD